MVVAWYRFGSNNLLPQLASTAIENGHLTRLFLSDLPGTQTPSNSLLMDVISWLWSLSILHVLNAIIRIRRSSIGSAQSTFLALRNSSLLNAPDRMMERAFSNNRTASF